MARLASSKFWRSSTSKKVDPAPQQQVIDLLRDVCRHEGVALLLVTHAEEVSKQFDRVVDFAQINHVMERVD